MAEGSVLRVNLSTRTVARERVPERWLRDYLGGKGLGARYLYEDVPAGTDPLGPDNLLAFLLGPLSGELPGETRYAAVTKSPLTGGFLDSYSGGQFPRRLAGSLDGALGILVEGATDEPVVLVVDEGDARIEPAADVWGRDTVETADAFPEAGVACIGPAGEQLVEYATVASDRGDHHAGRGGAGAVMGSKGLKAVVARGDSPEPSPVFADLRARDGGTYADGDTGRWLAAGETLESVDFANEVGLLATEGWQGGQFDGAGRIGIEAARDVAVGRENPDDAVPGGFRVRTDDGESVPRGAVPMTLGAGLGIDDFDVVATLGATCDRLGLDVISAGNAVAWAVRATAEGRVATGDDGEALAFGDGDRARRLLGRIARREGALGDALADGVDAAAERFGGDYIPTVKSMAVPSYDPRGAVAMALAYATSDRGGCHRRARPVEREAFARDDWDTEDRVRAVITAQTTRSVLWSLVADDFAGEPLWTDFGREWLAAAGREYSRDELRDTGRRIWTLIRLFNVREGFTREDDALPATFRQPLPDGPAAGHRIDPERFEDLLDAYYAARGWDGDGLPTVATVDRLGLADVVDSETPLATESHEQDSSRPR
ncbi:aldehyde:ferredoxin oxidoreductase [Halogranum gelatinilyticum]|uniref:Aldehyde:ferredoxin oxidoreductase n=1 Tax=Halogranum gelatinilyticum TaxID=660521 RepID=A0A1G9TEB4_9EURY|nr:aldehyde ferredoxin oxidoreductase C-terminal domain-containing protein [Halogranum gelatinilyticum]SDM45884.1 aldehyde:ferredoxin oxidoreductase [Halogranum gelatinilyticum]